MDFFHMVIPPDQEMLPGFFISILQSHYSIDSMEIV